MVRMARLTRLRGAWDYVYGTFRIRRILLLVLVALSVALGPFLFFLPYGLRMGLIYVYAGTISITGFFMYGAFRNTLKSAIGSIFLGWRYKPREFTPEQYAAFGIAQILNDMGIRKKVTICQTANPWIEGPFTNALTNKVYIPVSWLKKFPAPQDMRGVLGHELGHVKTKGKFGRESLLGMGGVMGLSLLVGLFSIQLVTETFELALAFLVLTALSWRNERRADMEGARVTGPEGLISVFEQLAAESKRDDGSETHPPLRDRILRLSKLLDVGRGMNI
jgi:Zn-dependent protease with chaperone function